MNILNNIHEIEANKILEEDDVYDSTYLPTNFEKIKYVKDKVIDQIKSPYLSSYNHLKNSFDTLDNLKEQEIIDFYTDILSSIINVYQITLVDREVIFSDKKKLIDTTRHLYSVIVLNFVGFITNLLIHIIMNNQEFFSSIIKEKKVDKMSAIKKVSPKGGEATQVYNKNLNVIAYYINELISDDVESTLLLFGYMHLVTDNETQTEQETYISNSYLTDILNEQTDDFLKNLIRMAYESEFILSLIKMNIKRYIIN